MSNKEKSQLDRMEEKMDLLLKKYGASQSLNDELPRGTDPVRKRQSKKVPVVDFKTMYRKKGII